MIMLTDEECEALRKKFFPHVNWTDRGPVRRSYLVRASDGEGDVLGLMAALAEAEGFSAPGQRTVTGDRETCLAAFREKTGGGVGMIFGTEAAAHWSDIALTPPESDGWRLLLVRSEEGENLTALAHNLGLLRFRRAE